MASQDSHEPFVCNVPVKDRRETKLKSFLLSNSATYCTESSRMFAHLFVPRKTATEAREKFALIFDIVTKYAKINTS